MKSLLVSISLLLLFHLTTGAQQSCTECARQGMLTEFENLHSPDYEQKLKEWQECMIQHSGGFTALDTSNANVRNALEECSGLNPGNRWHCDMSTMSTYIGERFSNQCFHLLSPIFYAPGTDKPPEYIFKGSYEAEIEGGRIIEYAEDYKKPVVARMELRLYYNGNSPELVQEWSSENTIPDPWALFNKLKTPKSLNPILDEFEKRPATCEVKIPSPEEFCDKGKGEIVLTGFKDSGGKTSREFNRIVVSIYKGEILNGEDSDYGPDYKVFTVGQGEVKIEYRPPAEKDDGYEWLRVYNSCDILPEKKYPMSRTQPDDLIVDQHFPIFCGFYQGTITVTKRWDYTKKGNAYTMRYTGTQTVNFSGIFKPIPQMEGMEGQPVKIFGKGTSKGTWQHNEQVSCEGDCSCEGLIREEYGSGSISSLNMDALIITTNVWPTEDKTVAGQLSQFGLQNWYDIATPSENAETQTRTRSKNKDNVCEWHNSNSTNNITGMSLRYRLEDILNLSGSETWSSSSDAPDIAITNLTEAIYDQKPFDPEKDGSDYTYTITWNLRPY